MKTLLILIFACLFFSDSFSQAPVFALPSSGYDIRGTITYAKVNNGYLGVRQVEKSKKTQNIRTIISVINYNEKMTELSESKLSDGEPVYSFFRPQIVQGNKIWVVCGDLGSWDQGNIRATEIDPKTYKPGASKIIVDAKELHESGQYATYELKIIKSPNAKYYCFYYGQGRSNEFYLACFNSDFEPVWKGKKKIPKTYTQNINDLSVNDNGEIIITSVVKSVATLSIYNVNGSEIQQPIDFGIAEPAFIDILQTKSGSTYVGGTLRKGSKFQNVAFLAKIKKDCMLTDMKQINFSDSVLNRLAKDGLSKSEDGKNGLTGVDIHSELVEQQDGRIKLVTETTYEKNGDYMGFGGLIITDFYKTENPFSLIPKFMVDFDILPRINQFVTAPLANSITVVYCDNEENINIDLKDKQKSLNGRAIGALYAATIDNNGIIKREIIASRSNKDDKRATAELIQMYIANKQ